MTDPQRDMLHGAFPKHRAKVVSFNDITSLGDVPDPVGGATDEVRELRVLLQSSMPLVFQAFEKRIGSKL
jgi:hypothetical protein